MEDRNIRENLPAESEKRPPSFSPLNKREKYGKREQYALLERAQKGQGQEREQAMELLVELHMGLVKKAAGRFAGKGFEWEDLLQVASLGLVKAVEAFDLSYEVMFSTYAVPVIFGELKRYIREQGQVRISRDMKAAVLNMRRVREEWEKKKGSPPRLSQLAEGMGISVEALTEILEAEGAWSRAESLDDPAFSAGLGPGGGGSGVLEGQEEETEGILLRLMIKDLPPREKQIILLRYFRDMTQAETARILGISQVHVSRLERAILKKLGASFGRDTQPAYPGSP